MKRERTAAVWAAMAMKARTKIGLKNEEKTNTIDSDKTWWHHIYGILSLLGVVGSLIGGVKGAKAINDNKATQRQLNETS